MTATLNGNSISPATSGLCPRVFCRYSVAKVMAELVVSVFSRAPAAPCRNGRSPSTALGQQRRRGTPVNDDEHSPPGPPPPPAARHPTLPGRAVAAASPRRRTPSPRR